MASCFYAKRRTLYREDMEGTIQKMNESESISTALDRIDERLDILDITLTVIRERIDLVASKLELLQNNLDE